MLGADGSRPPGGPQQQQSDAGFVQTNGYAAPSGGTAAAAAHGYSQDPTQWQAHDPAWQHYYHHHQQQPAGASHTVGTPSHPSQAQHHTSGQPPPPQPSADAPAGQVPSLQGGAAWQAQLQRPADWPQAQQSAVAGAQPYESGHTPPLPDEAAPPVPPPDEPPLPDAAQPPPGQPQWPQPAATPPPDAAQQQQWPQQQWPTPPQQQHPQQHWPVDPQHQYWQQPGVQQQAAWDPSHAAYAQNGMYAAPGGAYQYPQYQQWQQQYQQPAANPQAYQPHPQYAACGAAWPAAGAPYTAAQPPQQHQVPQSAQAAWQPATSAAATHYAPAVPSAAAPAQPKVQQVVPPRVTTAAELFWAPGRTSRPSRIVVLLRGPPGSGKSAAARRIRQLEQDAGGSVRVHSIDDYFVVEVEREVDDEKRAGRKRKITEMEYLYEAELEDSYEASLLKAYTKTVDEAKFKCVLVDAPLLAAAQLREYWRIGQQAGYEVFIGQPLEMDAQVCHKRNVHSRTLEDIQKAVAALQQPQPSFPQLDLSGIFGPPPSAEQPAEQDTGQPASTSTQQQQQQQQPPALPPAVHSIDEVDMEAGSDEERTPASRAPGGGRKRSGSGGRGGSSSDDDDDEQVALLGGATTRWGSLGDADEEVTPAKKKRKQDAAAVAEEDDEAFRTPAPTKRSGAPLRGILSTGGGGSAQRVRWADEGADEAAGFSVGGASREQLETVFVVEGLGPPMDDEQRQALGERSFEDQVKGEHHSEHQLFRDHMLGGRR